MTVLAPPRHPKVEDALGLARVWCAGHIIDGAPALRHAVEVALTVGRHVPDAPAELLAAVLLHDAPDFAPAGTDLDRVLTHRFGPSTTRIVRALEREHAVLGLEPPPVPEVGDPLVLCASAADKIVSLGSVVRRAQFAADQDAYWRARQPFLGLVPYFRTFATAAGPHLPNSMRTALEHAVVAAETVVAER